VAPSSARQGAGSAAGSPTPADGTTSRLALWWRTETRRLDREHPALARRLRAVGARPEAVLVPVAALVAGAFGAVVPEGDAGWFRAAGQQMLGAGFLDVFAASGLQIGPLYLLVLGVLARVAQVLGQPTVQLAVLAGVQGAGLVWFGQWTGRRTARHLAVPDLPVRWAVGLVLALGGFVAEGIGNGHPEELLVGLLLVHVALDAASGRHSRAGLLLGLAAAVKQWAVIGGGILLLTPVVAAAAPAQGLDGRARRAAALRGAVRGGLVAVAVTIVAYGPFLIFGHTATFEFAWGFSGGTTLLGRIGALTGASDWTLRAVQGGASALVGAWFAWRSPRSPLVPVAAAIAMRLLLDPLRLTYYSGPLVVVLVIAAWTSRDAVVGRYRLALTAATPLIVVLPYLLPRSVLDVTGTTVLLAVLAALEWSTRRHRRPVVAPAPTDAPAA